MARRGSVAAHLNRAQPHFVISGGRMPRMSPASFSLALLLAVLAYGYLVLAAP